MQYRPFNPRVVKLARKWQQNLRELESYHAAPIPLEEALPDLAKAFSGFGISLGQAAAAFLRVSGADVMAAPDDLICSVEDAPPMEIWRDGLRFDERGVCIGRVEDFMQR
jgi:hypothetical protein